MQLSLLTLALTKIYPRGKFSESALDLDFTSGNNTLDSRITFSRASNATVTGPDGVLRYAPHNLLTYSEQFDNAVWIKNNLTIAANVVTAPDGTTTADKLVENTATGTHGVVVAPAITKAGVYTESIYAKAGGRTALLFQLNAYSGDYIRGYFDLNTGTATSEKGGTAVSASVSMTAVGNGWYRCSVTGQPTTAVGTTVDWEIRILNGASPSYTGDGVSGIYIWGAQLNVGALQPYYSTTVKNLLGYTQEFDNAAWTKSNSFIQTNQIRNNTMQGAVAGTPGTLPTNWFVSGLGTLVQQVVGTGVSNGISYVDVRFSGTSSTTQCTIRFEANNIIAAANGQTWTHSFWTAMVGGSTANISQASSNANLYDSSVAFVEGITFSGAAVNTTGTLTRAGGSGTIAVATTAYIQPQIYLTFASGAAIDITLRIGMPQLVQGASAGDVVATYGTAKAVMYQAPDGTLSADKLVPNTTSGDHLVSESAGTAVSGTVYTLSVYAKAAGYGFVRLSFGNTAGGGYTFFNLTNGTVGTTGGMLSNQIESVGNGWYRCSVSRAAGSSATIGGDVYVTSSNNQFSWSGDGTSGIYVWGAQISDSASLDPYVYNPGAAPSASAYYGPRFDYDPITLQPKGLLIEEQRTNLLTYSEQFDNAAWTKTEITVSANSATAPDGTNTADKVVESTTASATHVIYQIGGSAATHALSFYLKAAERNWVNLRIDGTSNYFNLAAGTTGTIASGVTASITSVGNGWYKCAVSKTMSASGPVGIRLAYADSNDIYTGDGTSGIYIWGAQLEAGAFPTSYIPTTSAQVTRAADVATMTGTNFASWYNQSEGTLYAEAQGFGNIRFNTWANGSVATLSQYDGTTNNHMSILIESPNSTAANGEFSFEIYQNGTAQATIINPYNGNMNRYVAAYATNNVAAINSQIGTVGTDTSAIIPTVNTLAIGNYTSAGSRALNGCIKRLAYWNRRLSNAELQGVTA